MKKTTPFYIFVIAIFLIVISPCFLAKGMFLDGIVYANFAKQFAAGEGSFWHPFYSQTYLLGFQSHPPMFFALEGLWFKVFGTSFVVEKVFSVLCVSFASFLMVKSYKALGLKNGFLPVLFMVCVPLITWSATNNIIENTLMVFTTLSVLLYLLSLKRNRFLFLVLSALAISTGFSLKGFVALFPFSFPFIYWIVLKRGTFSKVCFDTALLIIIASLPILLSVLTSTDAREYFVHYFSVQMKGSLENAQTVDSRFYIGWRFVKELLPSIILVLLYGLIVKRKAIFKRRTNDTHHLYDKANSKIALVFFLFGLTAVLPIMLSMKQSGFYMLAAFPMVAISLAALIDDSVQTLLSKIDVAKRHFVWIKRVSFAVFAVSIVACSCFYGKYSRDKQMLSDVEKIGHYLPAKTLVSVPKKMQQEYSLFSYFARFYDISIDPNPNNIRHYFLVTKGSEDNFNNQDFIKIELETESLDLYRRSKE